MKVCYYKVGLELLDENKIPIEHLDYNEYDADETILAFTMYDCYKINTPYIAKYIIYVDTTGEERALASENYLLNDLYSLNDFKVGDVAYDTAFAEIRDKKLFDEFGNLIKEL